MSDSQTDAIVKAMETDPKGFGGALVHAASESFNELRKKLLVGRVREMMQHRNNLFAALEKTKRELNLYDSRIKAINAGEFTIEPYTGVITFKDGLLGSV